MILAAFILFLAFCLTVFMIAYRFRLLFFSLLSAVLIFQNMTIMILLRIEWVPVESARYLLYVKEVMIFAALLVLGGEHFLKGIFSRHIKLKSVTTLIIGYTVFLLVPFVLSSSPSLEARLAGFRFLALLPLLYLLGRWLFPSSSSADKIRALQTILVVTGVGLALFGFVEAYVLPQNFWLSIGHEEYYLMKQGRPIQGELYGNMRFWLQGNPNPVRRVASFTGDPLISSYPMSFLLILYLAFVFSRKAVRVSHIFLGILIGTAVLLTISRGAFVTLFITAGLLGLSQLRAARFTWLTSLGFLSAILIALTLGPQILNVTYGKGHIEHLSNGIVTGIKHPLGLGLGTSGSVASGVLGASNAEQLAGSDSFVGSAAIQTGIVGAFLLFFVFLSISSVLFRSGTRLAKNGGCLAWIYLGTGAMLAALLITSTVNESGYGFVATGMIFIFAGALQKQAETGFRAAAG